MGRGAHRRSSLARGECTSTRTAMSTSLTEGIVVFSFGLQVIPLHTSQEIDRMFD